MREASVAQGECQPSSRAAARIYFHWALVEVEGDLIA
jgi:hypothetical protein